MLGRSMMLLSLVGCVAPLLGQADILLSPVMMKYLLMRLPNCHYNWHCLQDGLIKGVSLTRRQKKRNNDKKSLFSKAFCLNSTIEHQSEFLANAEKELDSLCVQKKLYQV